ncbi:MAG: SHD1 domain-containing protein [Thermoguttaceae bacterium]|jgi:hypothetical protein
MKSVLACLLASLLAIVASSAFAKAAKSRAQPKKEPKPKVIMSNFSNEEAVPDPTDDIVASRQWKDATGEHSCQAQLQSVQSGDVSLKKEDGTVSKVSLPKLHKDDQDLVRSFLTRYALRQIQKAIQAYRQADLGDTSAKIEEKRKQEEEKLERKINGRVIRLVFPIKDVGAPDKGVSVLTLAAPDIKADGWDFRTTAKMKLSKEDALKTNSSSVLLVEGKAVVVHIGGSTKGQTTGASARGQSSGASTRTTTGGRGLENTDNTVLSYDDVQLTLDKTKMTVQHGQVKVEKATKIDVQSASVDRGATTKPAEIPAGIPAVTAAEALDVFDKEKSFPESSDEIAAPRKWRDSNGEHSVTAELQSMEAGSVALKKGDGTLVKVPFTKLYKEDQELVRSFLMLSSKRKIASAVASFLKTNFGDTDAHVVENEKVEAEKLCKTVNGRELRLVFPIKNVAPPDDQKGYKLNLSDPDFPKGGVSWRCQTSAYQKLTKEESLRVGPSSVLIVQGKVRVEFNDRREEPRRDQARGRRLNTGRGQRGGGSQENARVQSGGDGQENDSVLSWESPAVLPGGGHLTRRVLLFLDNPKMTVQYEQQNAKMANSKMP